MSINFGDEYAHLFFSLCVPLCLFVEVCAHRGAYGSMHLCSLII